jgi:vitamin B12 transporter
MAKKQNTKTLGITFLLLISLMSLSTTSISQTRNAITGEVKDEQGAKVGGAEVRLRSREGFELVTVTDTNGAFSLANPGPGDYLVEVKKDGFAALTKEMRLNRSSSENLELTLKVAGISEKVVVTAAGTPQRIDELSKAVSIVDGEEIDLRHELTLSETLRGVPGLRVQQQGHLGELTSVRLRGQRNFDTALLLDGLRVRDASDPQGSAFVLMADLVPVDFDRVEVLRGSGSSIYGSNAIGGAINLVQASGSGQPHFEFGFEGGNLSTFREHVTGSGGIGSRAGFSFGVNRIDVRHGVDGNDQYGNTGGIGRLHFNVTPSIQLSGSFYGTTSNARLNDSPFALPAAFGTGQRYPRAVAGVNFHSDFNNPDLGRRSLLWVGSLRFSQRVNEAVSYSVAYQHVTSKRRNYNGSRIDPRFAAFYPFGDFEFIAINEGATDTIDARLNSRLGRNNLLTAGFEYEQESLFQNSIPSFTAFNETTDRQRTFAFFGQDQVFLLDGRLQLSGAVRAQFYRIKAADRPAFLGSVNAERSITGDGSIAYFIQSTNTKLRGHVGNGFRSAALFERFGTGTFPNVGFVRFGDPTLRAEQSLSFDVGVDQRLNHDRVLASLTYFYTRLQRAIAFTSFVVDPLGAGRFNGYINRPGGLARGVETSVEVTPYRGTSVRGSYTYTNSDRFVPGRGLQPEFVIPANQFGLNFSQRYRAINFSFEINRTGAYIAPVFESNPPFRQAELKFDGYTRADLFGSYERRLNERIGLTIFAGADNIFDRTYYENGFRAAGIAARGGFFLRF